MDCGKNVDPEASHGGEAGTVTANDWKRVKELFTSVVALAEDERDSYLAAQPDSNEVLNEVSSLLSNYLESPDFLEGVTPPLPLGDLADKAPATLAGRRIGAWQLVREIGRGGMGVVWEARRADQQYDQRAAVKLLRASLERYLDGLPVQASRVTLAYRARKFVSRNRAAVEAAVLALLSLFIGLGVSMWEVHIALMQRTRAERHFNDVRKLANSLLFEIDDKIRDLPGATDARRLMVTRAGEYLDYLAGEAAGDTKLNLELADAYARLGQVQGNPSFPNLGDRSGALASYEKSSRIAEDVLRRDPKNAWALQIVVNSLSAEGWLMVTANRSADAVATQQKAVDASQTLVRFYPQETSYRQQLAEQLKDLGDMMGNPWFPGLGDIDGADRCYSRSLEIWSQSLAQLSQTPEMLQDRVRLYYSLSLLQWEVRGRSAPAQEWVQKALEKMQDLPPSQRDKAAELSRMGALYAGLGKRILCARRVRPWWNTSGPWDMSGSSRPPIPGIRKPMRISPGHWFSMEPFLAGFQRGTAKRWRLCGRR